MTRHGPIIAACCATVSAFVALGLAGAAVGRAPESATLTVQSNPAGASVFLAGEFRGTTPLELGSIEPGSYPVRLELGGHLPKIALLELIPPGLTLEMELEREPSGSIRVASVPTGADVFYEGVYRGVTPLLLRDMEVGEHQIRVEKANYHPWTGLVRVEDGLTAEVAPALADRILEFLEHALREDKSDILRNMEYAHHLFVRESYEAAAAAYGDGLLLSREQILDLSRSITEARSDPEELRRLRVLDRDKKEDLKVLERQMQRDAQAGPAEFRRLIELERARVQALFPPSAQAAINDAARAEREGDIQKALGIIERGIHVLGASAPLEEKLAHYQTLLKSAAE